MAKVNNTNNTKVETLTLGQKVAEDNKYQQEIRENAPTLYESMLADKIGDQYYLKRVIRTENIGGQTFTFEERVLTFSNPKLTEILWNMILKFSDNSGHQVADKQGGHRVKMTLSLRAFEREEIELMMISYLDQFASGQITLELDGDVIEMTVPKLSKFKQDTMDHTNNSLIKYIKKSFRIALTKMMEQREKVVEFMQDGVKYRVKQEIQSVFFDDVVVGTDELGNELTLDEIIADPNSLSDEEKEHSRYTWRKDGEYIKDNYKDVILPAQLEKFEILLDAIMSGQVDVNDLFHDVTGELIIEEVGRVIYGDKSNSYLQNAVRQLLSSMYSRMDKALIKQGMSGLESAEIRSTYARFPELSMEDNKMWADYQIESKIKRRFDWEDNPIYANVRKFDEDRVVEQSDVELVEQGLMTVKELIDKYKIKKGNAEMKSGKVYIYQDDELIEVKEVENENKKGGYVNIGQLHIDKKRGNKYKKNGNEKLNK